MVEQPHELATITPVKDIFIDEAKATKTFSAQGGSASGGKHLNTQTLTNDKKEKKWTKDDHKSPLEDEVEELKQHKAWEVLPDKKQDLFAEVLKKIKFPIPDDLQARLHFLVTSRVKEVRDDDQFLFYISRPVDASGLGLNDSQSQELLQTVKDVWHLVSQRAKEKVQPVLEEDKIVINKPTESSSKPKIFLPKDNIVGKHILHDVVKPESIIKNNKISQLVTEKQSIGPIEEIKNFSLLDLRRIGNNTADNFKRLSQKFKVLKKDSIVLYFQAVQVWYESPLYRQYQDLLFQAVNSGSKLKDLSHGEETLTWEEVGGIVELEKDLK